MPTGRMRVPWLSCLAVRAADAVTPVLPAVSAAALAILVLQILLCCPSPVIVMGAAGAPSEEPDVLGPAPGTYRVLSDDGEIRIPFEIFRDDILMIAEVNGVKLRMLLDNGSLWDQLLFFGSPKIDSLGLDYDSEIEVGGSGEGDPVTSKMAWGVSIRFAGVEFYDQPAITTPYSSGITSLWEGSDGQISAAFFKHFVVDINFDEWVITLIPPEEFDYEGDGAEIPMEPASFASWTVPGTLEMTDGSMIPLSLMLDLGDLHPLSLTTGPTYGIEVPEKAIETSLGFGVQGEITGHMGRVARVRLGPYEIENVLAGFKSPGEDGRTDDDAYIGFGLLSRFNVIFDYPGRRMFIEPNHRYSDPFEYSMTGMLLRKGPGGSLAVVRVYPDSPAAEAGFEVGDLVTHVDGEPTSKYKSWELAPKFLEEGRRVDFKVSRNGQRREVRLVLRRVI